MTRQKLPALQFYPGDWRKDIGIQAIGFFERGVWLELLCLMHESEQRGRLVLNGRPMPDPAIARVLGLDEDRWLEVRTKLLDYGIASEDDQGTLYNRRMVRDERVRQARAEAGRKGGKRGGRTKNPKESKSSANAKQTTKQNESETGSGFVANECGNPSGSNSSAPSKREANPKQNKPPSSSSSSSSSSLSVPDGTSVESARADADGVPVREMWDVFVEELGGQPPHPRLTPKRKGQLTALYREQLQRHPRPLELFRDILHAVQRSDHHMATRSYQMPESLFRNQERRDSWTQRAVAANAPPPRTVSAIGSNQGRYIIEE